MMTIGTMMIMAENQEEKSARSATERESAADAMAAAIRMIMEDFISATAVMEAEDASSAQDLAMISMLLNQ